MSVKIHTADGTPRPILNHINATCQQGERIGLLGRNGSGKSTLARLLAGLERATGGKIQKLPSRARVMLLLQRPEEHFSRATVLAEVASYAPKRIDSPTIYALLEKVGLSSKLAARSPRFLSTGQQRQVAIACALATQSSLLVLDEPMAGLDMVGRSLVRETLSQLDPERGRILFIISHHPDDLMGVVEQFWILDQGNLLYNGPLQNTPLAALAACLSPTDPSLFYALRRLESRDIPLPSEAYGYQTPQGLAAILSDVAEKYL
ncbi:MAG: ABC transporter ATP-binding protein [Ardenticatenales bacterium]|nr:ABC transporter ATP-binding protein [Ardenticatenales bacterium]